MPTHCSLIAALILTAGLHADGAQARRPVRAVATRPAAGWRQGMGRVPPGVKQLRNLKYAEASGKPLLLDLYIPPTSQTRPPLVVWVHGGAWRSGSKENCPAVRLTAEGFAAASINYRLTDVACFPAQIHDCKAAIRWLRAHANEYGYDPDRIGVWGGSAGGHLVALLGTSGGTRDLEGDEGNPGVSSKVQAVCDYFGPADLTAIADAGGRQEGPDSVVGLLLGGGPADHPDKAKAASPVTYASPDDPPFLIVHGDKDPVVPLHQSEMLEQALRKAKVDVRLHVVKDAGHGQGFGATESNLVAEFFTRTLKQALASQPVG